MDEQYNMDDEILNMANTTLDDIPKDHLLYWSFSILLGICVVVIAASIPDIRREYQNVFKSMKKCIGDNGSCICCGGRSSSSTKQMDRESWISLLTLRLFAFDLPRWISLIFICLVWFHIKIPHIYVASIFVVLVDLVVFGNVIYMMTKMQENETNIRFWYFLSYTLILGFPMGSYTKIAWSFYLDDMNLISRDNILLPGFGWVVCLIIVAFITNIVIFFMYFCKKRFQQMRLVWFLFRIFTCLFSCIAFAILWSKASAKINEGNMFVLLGPMWIVIGFFIYATSVYMLVQTCRGNYHKWLAFLPEYINLLGYTVTLFLVAYIIHWSDIPWWSAVVPMQITELFCLLYDIIMIAHHRNKLGGLSTPACSAVKCCRKKPSNPEGAMTSNIIPSVSRVLEAPKMWFGMTTLSNDCSLHDVPDPEAFDLKRFISETWDHFSGEKIHIKNIQHLQNDALMFSYNSKKQEFLCRSRAQEGFPKITQKPWYATKPHSGIALPSCSTVCYKINETLLFHGTTTARKDGILQKGIDFRLARSGNYGSGIYMSEDPKFSDNFTGGTVVRYMFIVRALLGESCVLTDASLPNLRRPPCKTCYTNKHKWDDDCTKHGEFYDSIVGNIKGRKYREFVVYDLSQTVPEYLIEYTRYKSA